MNKIKELRHLKGLTIAEVSEITGISKTSLTNYENGKRIPRDMHTWEILADFFDVSTPYLMGIDDNTQSQLDENSSYPWNSDPFFNKFLKRSSEELAALFEGSDEEFNRDLLNIFKEIADGYSHLYETDKSRKRFEAYRKIIFILVKYSTMDFDVKNDELSRVFMMMKHDEQTVLEFFEYYFYLLLKESN